MNFYDRKKDVLRQLKEFRERIYSASSSGDPTTRNVGMFWDDDYDDQLNTDDDKLPFFQVMKAVEQSFDLHKWVRLFLVRIERTLYGMPKKFQRIIGKDNEDFFFEEYFVKPWKVYLDESRYLLTDSDFIENDDEKNILIRYENVTKYEEQLNQRKLQFESLHGQ